MLRDNLGRFAKSKRLWKFVGFLVVVGFVWFWVHMFFSLYTLQNKNGVHGIVAKATYNALIEDHAKAESYDSIPSKYLISDQ